MFAALLAIVLAQAGRQRPVNPPTAPITDWKIEITTDGGITGGGSGGLIVSSDGSLVITFGTGSSKRCTYRLTAGELQAVDAAVRNARPTAWWECYSAADVSTHCCDLIRTTLTLSARNGRDVYTTSWLIATLPADLENIHNVLRGNGGIDAHYRALCLTTP
jgi:hypothetical protein